MDNSKWARIAAVVGFVDLALCGASLFLLQFILQSDDLFVRSGSTCNAIFLTIVWSFAIFVRSFAAVGLIKSSISEPERARKGSTLWLNINLIWFLLTLPIIITIGLAWVLRSNLLGLQLQVYGLQIAIAVLSCILTIVCYGVVSQFSKELKQLVGDAKPGIKVVLPEIIISTKSAIRDKHVVEQV